MKLGKGIPVLMGGWLTGIVFGYLGLNYLLVFNFFVQSHCSHEPFLKKCPLYVVAETFQPHLLSTWNLWSWSWMWGDDPWLLSSRVSMRKSFCGMSCAHQKVVSASTFTEMQNHPGTGLFVHSVAQPQAELSQIVCVKWFPTDWGGNVMLFQMSNESKASRGSHQWLPKVRRNWPPCNTMLCQDRPKPTKDEGAKTQEEQQQGQGQQCCKEEEGNEIGAWWLQMFSTKPPCFGAGKTCMKFPGADTVSWNEKWEAPGRAMASMYFGSFNVVHVTARMA